MAVIHPGLFLVLRRFPERKDDLRQIYYKSKSFQSVCHNYQKCSEAIRYWDKSEHEEAADRHQEYKDLLHDLELEIIEHLKEEA